MIVKRIFKNPTVLIVVLVAGGLLGHSPSQASEIGRSCRVVAVLDFCDLPYRKRVPMRCETIQKSEVEIRNTDEILLDFDMQLASPTAARFILESRPRLQIQTDEVTHQISIHVKTEPGSRRDPYMRDRDQMTFSIDAQKNFPGAYHLEEGVFEASGINIRYYVRDSTQSSDFVARVSAVLRCQEKHPVQTRAQRPVPAPTQITPIEK